MHIDFLKIISSSTFSTEPFPHWISESALDLESLSEIQKKFPLSIENHKKLLDSGKVLAEYNQNTAYPLEFDVISPVDTLAWFVRSWESQREEILEYIRPHLPTDLQKQFMEVKRRSFSRGDFRASSPVTIEGTTQLGPHLDSPFEILAGLIYLRNESDDAQGGDLQIYGLNKSSPSRYMSEKRRVPSKYLEPLRKVPYGKNVALFFLSHPLAIHGISKRGISSFDRRLINLSIELPENSNLRMFDSNAITDWKLTGKSRFSLVRKLQNRFPNLPNVSSSQREKSKYGKYDWAIEDEL